ncbi:uncharacterized protein V6R79_003109 [Siganus canaliculatus]
MDLEILRFVTTDKEETERPRIDPGPSYLCTSDPSTRHVRPPLTAASEMQRREGRAEAGRQPERWECRVTGSNSNKTWPPLQGEDFQSQRRRRRGGKTAAVSATTTSEHGALSLMHWSTPLSAFCCKQLLLTG